MSLLLRIALPFLAVAPIADNDRTLGTLRIDLLAPRQAKSAAKPSAAVQKLLDEGMAEGLATKDRPPILERALALARATADRDGEGQALMRLGYAYRLLGDLTKALEHYELALPIFHDAHDLREEATTINNIAMVYYVRGERAKALALYERALPLRRAVGDRHGEATTLTNIGALYRALGDRAKALVYYKQALPLYRALNDRAGEGLVLDNIGGVYDVLGDRAKALEYYRLALTIARGAGNKSGEATASNNLAGVYGDLGEPAKALEYLTQAKSIFRALGDKAGEAGILDNMGLQYEALNERAKAQESYGLALPIHRAVGDKEGEATSLGDAGRLYDLMGETDKGLDLLNQALSIFRQAGDRAGEASTLNDIGVGYGAKGERAKEIDALTEAIPILHAVGDRSNEAATLNNLASSLSDTSVPTAAWLQSLSIRMNESLRHDIRRLPAGQQRGFGNGIAFYYEALAAHLGSQGRTAEMEQVLALAKTDPSSDSGGVLPLTEVETRWTATWDAQLEGASQIIRKTIELQALASPSVAQADELRKSTIAYAEAVKGMVHDLDAVVEEARRLDPTRSRIGSTATSKALRDSLADLPKGASAIYALPYRNFVHLFVVSRGRQVLRTVAAKGIRAKVAAFRAVLQDPEADPRPIGRELYDLLVRPIESQLDPNAPVLWSLVGDLRGLAVGALWAGHRFLTQKYALGAFSPAFVAALGFPPRRKGGARVYGTTTRRTLNDPVTHESVAFASLPAVRKEVSSATASLGGRPVLDGAFTVRKILADLKARPATLHLASHFRYVPGDDRRSFLLTGDGGIWTVEAIKALPRDALKSLDLVTLSACATANAESATGDEAESFAAWMQRKGAASVLSTLWPVADESTAILMGRFYRLRKTHSGWNKLQALRAAQLEMIQGKAAVRTGPERRAVSATASVRSDAPPWPKNLPRYAHPYYWAPFILTGDPR